MHRITNWVKILESMKGVTPNMKKSHEYDSPVLSRLVSVVTVLAICVCSICCIVTASKVSNIATGTVAVNSDSQSSNNATASNNTSSQQANNNTSSAPVATGDSSADNAADSSADNAADSSGDSGDAAAADETPAGPTAEEVLAKYTEVMDTLKQNVADGNVLQYNKKEFQSLSDDYDLGTIGNLVIPIAQGLMTSEDEASEQERTDYEQIPVTHNIKGCLLTDASAIKSYSMTESGGKTTVEIVLNDEVGAYPAEDNATSCGSIIGSVFNPLDQDEIDDIVANFSGVADIQTFTLTCKDCTATVVFDTETLQVESIKQIMNYYIEVDAKVVIMSLSGYATLTNEMNIYNVQYK